MSLGAFQFSSIWNCMQCSTLVLFISIEQISVTCNIICHWNIVKIMLPNTLQFVNKILTVIFLVTVMDKVSCIYTSQPIIYHQCCLFGHIFSFSTTTEKVSISRCIFGGPQLMNDVQDNWPVEGLPTHWLCLCFCLHQSPSCLDGSMSRVLTVKTLQMK